MKEIIVNRVALSIDGSYNPILEIKEKNQICQHGNENHQKPNVKKILFFYIFRVITLLSYNLV